MNAGEIPCLHCGTPVPPGRDRFCCAGCEHVFNLLAEGGLENFYRLRGNATLAPVPPQALRERDWTWLGDLAKKTEDAAAQGSAATLELAVQGLSCLGCVWLVESVFHAMPGARRIEIQTVRGRLRLAWQNGEFDVVEFARRIQQFGYLVGQADAAPTGEVFSLGRRTGLCAAFAMNAMAFSLPAYLGMDRTFIFASWFDLIAACSATLALLVGGSYFAQRSATALRHGILHIDTPVTLGIAAAWLGSMAGWLGGIEGLKYFDFVAVFVFLMLAGRLLQQAAVERNRRRLLQTTMVPDCVPRLDPAGVEAAVPLAQIARGDVLLIKPGAIFPMACLLRSEQATLSLEWINGESEAARRSAGGRIPSGAINIGATPIEAVSLEPWEASLLHQLCQARPAGHSSPAFAGLLRGYLAVVLVVGLAGFAFWLAHGAGAGRALQVMISVFVVSCPCALGVAAPFADDYAAHAMERLGLFVRASNLWQRLARVRTIVFDKTGTMTMEDPQLVNPEALDALDADDKAALRVLAAASLHPTSRSLFEALGPGSAEQASIPTIDEEIGQGVSFVDDRKRAWSLGRPGWRAGMEDADCVFARDGQARAGFRFREALRPRTMVAVETLRHMGYSIHLSSGDRSRKVARLARDLGLPPANWRAEANPAQKAAHVAALDPGRTMFVGDGANDSLAFAEALCTGSPVTGRNFLEHKADFHFLGNSLRFLPRLFETARQRRKAVRRVFIFAMGYNAVAVALSLAGHMSPLLAAILMPLSSLATLGLARLSFGNTRPARIPFGPSGVQTAPDTRQMLRGAPAEFAIN